MHFSRFFLLVATSTERTTRTQNVHFRRRFGYTTTPRPSSRQTTVFPETSTIADIVSTRSSTDQDIDASIVDRKFSGNQIDLNTDLSSPGLAEAITSISRAPLPFIVSTTIQNVRLTTPGSVRYDDDFYEYQIAKRADSVASGSALNLLFVYFS